jgi:hypothetical protein
MMTATKSTSFSAVIQTLGSLCSFTVGPLKIGQSNIHFVNPDFGWSASAMAKTTG